MKQLSRRRSANHQFCHVRLLGLVCVEYACSFVGRSDLPPSSEVCLATSLSTALRVCPADVTSPVQNYVSRRNILEALLFLGRPNAKNLVSGTRERESLHGAFKAAFETKFPGKMFSQMGRYKKWLLPIKKLAALLQ